MRPLSFLLALSLLALHSVASAQSAPDQSGFSSFPSTRPPGPWSPDGTLWLNYEMRSADRAGTNHQFGGTANAQLGIMSRGAVAVRLPFLAYQHETHLERRFERERSDVGNLELDGRFRLLGSAASSSGAVKDGSALALRAVVAVPSSHADFATRFSAISDIEVFGVVAGAELAYGHVFSTDGKLDLRDFLSLGLGFRLPFRLLSRLWPGHVQDAALVEFNVQSYTQDFFDKTSTPVFGRLGYRLVYDDIYSTLLFGTSLNRAVFDSPDLQVLLGIGWAPRRHDQDADGVPDSRDQCVHLPEDRDGFEDQDGCADDDNDGDMIVDEDDRCPLQAAEEGRDEDEDGCTDP